VYLPAGPAEWLDFWTGQRVAAGREIVAPAPLERIPLYVPAGAVIPTTDTTDMKHLHDEPSRALRIFPAGGEGRSEFTLYEDDGLTHRYKEGDHAELECAVEWTSREIVVTAKKNGGYALPYSTLRVIVPPEERRRLRLDGDGIALQTRGRR
jgi:alpha-glucosidase